MNGLNKAFFSILIAALCVGGLVGCSNGDDGGNNAEAVKKLADDPSNKTNNNPDVPPLSKDQLGVSGSDKPGKK